MFKGRLPLSLPIVWTNRLASTAGQVVDDGAQPGAPPRVPSNK